MMGVAKSSGYACQYIEYTAASSFLNSGLEASKAGQQNTVAKFGTVPPKSGQLTPMHLAIFENKNIKKQQN